jgi:hypothetical protein
VAWREGANLIQNRADSLLQEDSSQLGGDDGTILRRHHPFAQPLAIRIDEKQLGKILNRLPPRSGDRRDAVAPPTARLKRATVRISLAG